MKFPTEIINRILKYSDNIYAYFTFGLNDVKLLNHIIVQSNGTISMLKKGIEGSHTSIIDWIVDNKLHISPKIILAYTIYAKDIKIIDYILQKISCTSYDLCYMQILYLKYGRFDLFKDLHSIYPIPNFYLITVQPFSFLDKKMSVLNFSEDKTDSLVFPFSLENRNVNSLPDLSNSNTNNLNALPLLKQKNKLYISQLAQDLIEALYIFTIQNKYYDDLLDEDKSILDEYFKTIASFYSYDPWNYRPWKRDDNGWYIMYNSLIVFFIKNKMYDVLDKIDNIRKCLNNDINRSLFLCKGIKLEAEDISSLKDEYKNILEQEYCIINGNEYNPYAHIKFNKNNILMKANQDMNIDIFFGSIINGQLHTLKDYFNLDIYNFETFLYYYLDRVTDINVMIENTISTNLKEFLDTLYQLPLSLIFHHSQDSKLYIYELIQSMITHCLKTCNYEYIDYIIDNILMKYNISRYNLECCFNDAFYSNCSHEVIKIMKHLISRLYEYYILRQNERISNDSDDNDRSSTETFGDNEMELDNNEDEIFGYAPYNLKLKLGYISETITIKDYHLSEFKVFKKYEELIWPLIVGQHHWLNNSADLMTLISYLLLKINSKDDLYNQYVSFIVDVYREPQNTSSEDYDKTSLLKNIITSSEKKSFMYLSDINPNNIIYLSNKLNVNKHRFYSFLYHRFNNSNPFLTFKKMFQSKLNNKNSVEKPIFNKYNYPLSSEECRQFFENNNKVSTIDNHISQMSAANCGQMESNFRQLHQSHNIKISKSDNSIELIDQFNKSRFTSEPSKSDLTTSKIEKCDSSSKSSSDKKGLKNYLNKRYCNINVYEFKEIFKESSEWKEILSTISNNKKSNSRKNKNKFIYNNELNNYSMIDLFSLIYDI